MLDMRKYLALAVIPLVLAGCSQSAEDKKTSEGFTAQVMCEDFVKDKLKAPKTADFSEQVRKAEGHGWRITGVVDSENSFGAAIRGHFVCVLENTTGDTWEASTVEVTEG